MPRYPGRPGDEVWGIYDYPVTRTQKAALEGLEFILRGLPRVPSSTGDIPEGYFCSQNPTSGIVIVGLHHRSLSVHRSGRVTSNEKI